MGGLALDLCVERDFLEDTRHAETLREIAFEHHGFATEMHLVGEIGRMVVRAPRGGDDLTDHLVEGVFFVVVEDDTSLKPDPRKDLLFWVGPLKWACKYIRGKSLHNVGYKTTKRPIFVIHE